MCSPCTVGADSCCPHTLAVPAPATRPYAAASPPQPRLLQGHRRFLLPLSSPSTVLLVAQAPRQPLCAYIKCAPAPTAARCGKSGSHRQAAVPLSPSGLSPQQCPEQLPRAGHAVGLQGGAAGKPAPRFGAGSTPQRWHLLGERKEPPGSLPAPRSPATRRGQAQLCRVPASRETAGSRPW